MCLKTAFASVILVSVTLEHRDSPTALVLEDRTREEEEPAMQGNASQHAALQQQQELQSGFRHCLPSQAPAQLHGTGPLAFLTLEHH